MFSTRVPADRRPNRLSAALAAARHTRELIDLTLTNPTRAGIRYPDDLLAGLSDPRGLAYRPEPFGLEDARAAVAATYGRRGLRIRPERVILTASTSEAYSLLFKLTADPGADVLTPVPSYPLFDHLAALDGVRQQPYGLWYDGRWTIDLRDLDEAWSRRTRAVLAVSPNNPTGSRLDANDAVELVRRCAEREAALVVDEVFADYPLAESGPEPDALRDPGCLVFRLGGLSKSGGLPQVKLGWIVAEGPRATVDAALDRLELICDTYLSVSTPVQLAARDLIARSGPVRAQILDRVRRNYSSLQRMLAARADSAVSLLHADGGWSAVLRVPATHGEEALALDLLDHGVVVHPGFFFDFAHEAFLVLSLLPEPDAFDRGAGIVLERAHAA